MAAHTLSPRTLEPEEVDLLSLSLGCSTERVPGQAELYRETVCEGRVKGHSLLKRLIMLIPEGGISHLAHTATLYCGSDSNC